MPNPTVCFLCFCTYKRLRLLEQEATAWWLRSAFRKDAGDDAGAPASEQEQQRRPGRPNVSLVGGLG